MRKLCINAGVGFKATVHEKVLAVKKAGFDGIFHEWISSESTAEYFSEISAEGLFYQSIHAPFTGMAQVWDKADSKGDEYIKTLISCVDDCARYEVPILVCHAFIGFKDHTPTEIGLSRLEKLIRHAEKRNVLTAFENTEGEEYLAAVMNRFSDSPVLRFCIDTGHEMCYNPGKDMITLYGSKLAATHLNDNMGVTGEKITYLDDAHLMPFDGKADWKNIADRLNKCSYKGPLTFELTRCNKPGRTTHDRYMSFDLNQFNRIAYERARRFAEMIEK